MKANSFLIFFSSAFLSVFSATGCQREAEVLQVGVAANYTKPFEEIALAFENETGIKVEATFTSTGNLYNQIINGAPYDLFLSADEERPESLFSAGISERPFVYASGKVILWSADPNFADSGDWKTAVTRNEVLKIALANPETAPYGTSSLKAVESEDLYDSIKDKFVYAQTIAQAFQWASTGAVDAGFCAYSSAFSQEGKEGSYFFVEEAPPIVQSACLLMRTERRSSAEKFIEFLKSSESEEIKARYGYE